MSSIVVASDISYKICYSSFNKYPILVDQNTSHLYLLRSIARLHSAIPHRRRSAGNRRNLQMGGLPKLQKWMAGMNGFRFPVRWGLMATAFSAFLFYFNASTHTVFRTAQDFIESIIQLSLVSPIFVNHYPYRACLGLYLLIIPRADGIVTL